jgi:hypothetical protein
MTFLLFNQAILLPGFQIFIVSWGWTRTGMWLGVETFFRGWRTITTTATSTEIVFDSISAQRASALQYRPCTLVLA